MTYMLENSATTALERLQAFERMLDPKTQALLSEHLPTKRMWIPGAGAGSIAKWAAPLVRKKLVVSDIDTRFLSDLPGTNVSVIKHNLTADPIPDEFDLVAVRLLLCHLPKREAALEKLVCSLAPDGVLLIEEPCQGVQAIAGKSKQLFNNTMLRIRNLQSQRGFSYDFAERLPELLFNFGLQDIQYESSRKIYTKNDTLLSLIRLTWSHMAASSKIDLTPAFKALNDDDLVLASFKNVACSGVR